MKGLKMQIVGICMWTVLSIGLSNGAPLDLIAFLFGFVGAGFLLAGIFID